MNHTARRINTLAKALRAKTYLEIGVENGITFLDVDIEIRNAVDPNFRLDIVPLANEQTCFHPVPSDQFFAQIHNGATFDIIFIDGLHVFPQVLRDLSNSLLNIHPNSAILLDDTIPSDVFSAIPDYQETMRFRSAAGLPGDNWHGDVFKTVFYIHDFWPGLNYVTIAGHENPQTLIWRSTKFHRQPRFDSLERISRMDYFDLMRNIDIMRQRTEAEALALCISELQSLGTP
jgi:hypothetical protein